MRFRLVIGLLALAGASVPAPARAGVEVVQVASLSQDQVVVQRANGDLWRLALDQDCRSLSGYPGHRVLIHSAVAFPGPAPRILIPEWDLTCRTLRADSVGHRAPPTAPEVPAQGLRAMRDALEQLGYNCGPLQEHGWTADAADAFARYRASRRLDATPNGLKRALVALAIDTMGRRPTGTGLRRSRAISDQSDDLVEFLWSGGNVVCGEPTFLRTVAPDRSYFALGDGTVWDVESGQRSAVAAWLANDGVLACSGRLINLRTGEMARASRLR